MTTYIFKGCYSSEGIEHVSAERTTEGKAIIQRYGGKVIAIYATLGDSDILLIVDFPSEKEVIKASIAMNKALGISFSSVPAISIEEFDKLVGSNG